jgi:hypothetical protein
MVFMMLTSVARFTGFKFGLAPQPSTEVLGYCHPSASRTKSAMLDDKNGYTNNDRG